MLGDPDGEVILESGRCLGRPRYRVEFRHHERVDDLSTRSLKFGERGLELRDDQRIGDLFFENLPQYTEARAA
jgi:hypothetical protein